MTSLKYFLSCSILIGLILGMSACGSTQTPPTSEEPERTITVPQEAESAPEETAGGEQTFTVAVGRDSGVLNPHDYKSNFPALTLVYESLVNYAADGSIEPALAERWEVSDDGLEWTFHLRQGVTFHDGTPFNAEAVKWNLERWIGEERHSWIPTANEVESIDTPDDHTVVLHMKKYFYSVLQDLTIVRPVRFLSPAAVDDKGEFVAAIGTGPWKLESSVSEGRAVFVPYEAYWGEKPQLSRVIFEVIADPEARVAAFLDGKVDLIGGEYIGGIPPEAITTLEADADTEILQAEGTATYLVRMNSERPPFDDQQVREAFNLVIDREAIASDVFNGLAEPAQGLFPPNVPFASNPHPELYSYDVERARQLLEEAGWTLNGDGILEKEEQPFEVEVVVDGAIFPQAESMVNQLRTQLQEVGIQMEIRITDFDGWTDALRKGDFHLATDLTYGAPYDPHSTLTSVFQSGLSADSTQIFTDPTLDKLISEVLVTRTDEERQSKYDQIFEYLDEQVVIAPIVYSRRVYALNKAVQGFELAGTEYELNLVGVHIVSP
ncbi:MAG: nickel ABC transporter, nickel/metallophore periplasmic binding protein [Ardenticatenales bacterium]|nr:nickel ABC transporter, nickel/metallophore periplasmic binding protein [Ardenticatenales bacterium]